MRLSKKFLESGELHSSIALQVPPSEVFTFPEKVLQFGTGVLQRGLCDFYIDKANRAGIFKGRVVVVKSTAKGGADAFDEQDGLYTHCIKGIDEGVAKEENIINSSISRTITASKDWDKIIECAKSEEMQIILSNTTEVGITYVANDPIANGCPSSFPAKLLAFLHARFTHFAGATKAGMVIVPTELIINNGDVLKGIVLKLAADHGLSAEFVSWLETANHFCNSLVDRIVPGSPDAATNAEICAKLGYEDSLMIISEVYSLWAIQGGAKVKEVLSFAPADKGVIIAEDIEIYRELKLRLLNGTHTLLCGMSFLLGFRLVKDVMANGYLSKLIMNLMLSELALGIPYKMDFKVADRFGRSVLDRFRNPFINHKLIDITVQYTTKMRMRNVPLLINYAKNFGKAPELFCMGFAAYLQFMHAVKVEDGKYFGDSNGEAYPIQCDYAPYFYEAWKDFDLKKVLSNTDLWGTDLTKVPGFVEGVTKYI
ncbi:tagaturonate reductase [Aquirufa antheringensis]|jgi:tagaturonate reductase|uniref:Tagaturonate reductase n=1 Tax=Aquirufa antheringensis TaxID=2516559 RepID=A0A4Q9BFG5_9BACT|nr:tagaturonate reductase [Aquirufa antheringensis]MCZ2486879.1 tagaturonate reductase [Aquirufa antheringensis]TBH74992.1 tagaturonate reductase [Aquirufa antheringensis]